MLYASDAVQFRKANKALLKKINSDSQFKKDLLTRHPELKSWLNDSKKLSNSPTGFTWHHSEETGILRLVD